MFSLTEYKKYFPDNPNNLKESWQNTIKAIAVNNYLFAPKERAAREGMIFLINAGSFGIVRFLINCLSKIKDEILNDPTIKLGPLNGSLQRVNYVNYKGQILPVTLTHYFPKANPINTLYATSDMIQKYGESFEKFIETISMRTKITSSYMLAMSDLHGKETHHIIDYMYPPYLKMLTQVTNLHFEEAIEQSGWKEPTDDLWLTVTKPTLDEYLSYWILL